ncbi:hypothetical protein TKK_0008462 [Trichogramma kaykai]|uniref:BED-type domain-containing protein n=1 Tax=Trichogramma kaykai TaxID=54128 RepID=A0ABD2X6K5_9HYME
MENIRYDDKIESFEACLIDGGNQQEINDSENNEPQTQEINVIDVEENSESTAMQSTNDEQGPTTVSLVSSANLTPIRIPAILDGEFFVVTRLEESNVTAKCTQCQKFLNGNLKSTGNFLSHIKRVHPFLLEKIKSKSNQRRSTAIFVEPAERNTDINRAKMRPKKYTKIEERQALQEDNYESEEWIEQAVIKKKRNEEFDNNEMRVSQHSSVVTDDEFDAIGRNVAFKLRNMKSNQKIIAEKLINDVLFQAQLGTLQLTSLLQL